MIVVSDTSPISNLIQIDALFLLKKLYTHVLIPESVFEELCRIPEQKRILEASPWIEEVKLANRNQLPELMVKLDEGEAEAILLALEFKADYLLIDELAGRKYAKNVGLSITGILGVLIESKQKSLIPEVKSYMDQLISKANFRIRKDLYTYILSIAKEN